MRLFPLSGTRLSDGVFRDAHQTDLDHLLTLDPDRLLAPYRREAAVEQTAPPYGNWESSGLDGHTAGHALSAAVLLHAARGDERAAALAAALVDGLAQCQDAVGTGYVGGVPHGAELGARTSSGDDRGTGGPTAFTLSVGGVLVAEVEVPADASGGVTTQQCRLDEGVMVAPPPEGTRVRIPAHGGRSTPEVLEVLEVRLLAGGGGAPSAA